MPLRDDIDWGDVVFAVVVILALVVGGLIGILNGHWSQTPYSGR